MNEKANASGNKLIKAYTFSLHTKIIISQEIDYIAFQFNLPKSEGHKDLFTNYIHVALTAFNLFVGLNQFKDAFNMLCNAIELLEVAERRYHYHALADKQHLLDIKKDMESTLELNEYHLVIPSLFDRMAAEENKKEHKLAFLKDMDQQEIENLARMTLKAHRLPPERLPNIVREMLAYKTFYLRCPDVDYEIDTVIDVPPTRQNQYAVPLKFVLRSKKTGFETQPYANVNDLLDACGF